MKQADDYKYYRHGDLIIRSDIPIPDEAKEQPHLKLVEGEATGHAHEIVKGAATHLRFNGEVYLKALKGRVKIDHPDHGPDWIEKGDYKIDIQQEWKEDGWTKVID